MRTDPKKVEALDDEAQDDGARPAQALLHCNLLALDMAGAARGSLLFPTLTTL